MIQFSFPLRHGDGNGGKNPLSSAQFRILRMLSFHQPIPLVLTLVTCNQIYSPLCLYGSIIMYYQTGNENPSPRLVGEHVADRLSGGKTHTDS